MTEHNMDILRKQLRISGENRFRVVFEFPYTIPLFVCVVCDEPMMWRPQHFWWSCIECGVEVTAPEAVIVATKLDTGVERLRNHVAKRTKSRSLFQWLLQKVFGRRKQLPLLSDELESSSGKKEQTTP